MAEKRRATTFVTSRGAIINVAAPSVYIAPGVTPVDVINPAELREELDIHSAFTYSKFLKGGVDAHFDGRTADLTALGWVDRSALPSNHWTQLDYGAGVGINRYEGYQSGASMYTKKAFSFPLVVARAIFPTLTVDGQVTWFGVENDANTGNGIAGINLTRWAGVIHLFLVQGGNFDTRYVDVTNLLPADYTTAQHKYAVEVTNSMVVYWLDNSVLGYGLLSPSSYITPVLGPPYALFSSDQPFPKDLLAFIESTLPLRCSPYEYRVSGGRAKPPRVIRMYDAGTTNLLAGLVIAAGSETSHPFPVFGYEGKTLYFQATQAGTLLIEVLTQTNNWRTYDSVATAANTLLGYPMAGDAVLARVTFTPTTFPATVSDAEVILR